MLLHKLILTHPEEVKPYADVKAEWDAQEADKTTGVNIEIQAEDAVKTSSQMLYPKQDQSSPAVYPASTKALLNNTIGGASWSDAGQWIEWEFEVPEAGYYNISMMGEVFMFPVRFISMGKYLLKNLRITASLMIHSGDVTYFRMMKEMLISFI